MAIPQPAGSAEDVQGRTIVVDGDSLVVDGKSVRIWGIDAPEMGTRSGDRAKKYLRALLADNAARCEDDGKRVSGQIMAKCFIGSVDIGRVMVLSGNARDWRRYSGGLYARELEKAGFPVRRRKQVAKRPKRRTRLPSAAYRPATPIRRPQRTRGAARTPVARPAPPPALDAPFTPVAPPRSGTLSPPTDLRPVQRPIQRPALPPVTAAPRVPVEATPFVFPAPPSPPSPSAPLAVPKAPERQSEPAPPNPTEPVDED